MVIASGFQSTGLEIWRGHYAKSSTDSWFRQWRNSLFIIRGGYSFEFAHIRLDVEQKWPIVHRGKPLENSEQDIVKRLISAHRKLGIKNIILNDRGDGYWESDDHYRVKVNLQRKQNILKLKLFLILRTTPCNIWFDLDRAKSLFKKGYYSEQIYLQSTSNTYFMPGGRCGQIQKVCLYNQFAVLEGPYGLPHNIIQGKS